MNKITSIESYLSWVRECSNLEVEGLALEQHHLFFRGQANKTWKLTPPLFRMDDIAREVGVVYGNEYQLIQDAYRHAWKYLQKYSSDLEKLIVLQHYGLRTRLLDLTSNPLIALYFACMDDKEKRKEGKVFCYCAQSYNGDRYARVVAKTVAIGANMGLGLDEFLVNEYQNFFIRERKASIKIETVENWKKELFTPQFFLVPYNNHRITAQRGAFFIAPLSENDDSYEGAGYTVGHIEATGTWKSVIVSASCKKTLVNELALLGIDQSTVFPDFEHLLKFLNSKYQLRNNYVPIV